MLKSVSKGFDPAMRSGRFPTYPTTYTVCDRLAATTIAETTTIKDKLSEKTIVVEEIKLGLFNGFEDATALEDKKSLTVFSAIGVCIHDYVSNSPAVNGMSSSGVKSYVPLRSS